MKNRIYKFLMSSHVHHLLEENTVRLGRQSYYREKYEKDFDEWIGDPEEGKSSLAIEHLPTAKLDDSGREVMRRLGLVLHPAVTELGLRGVKSVVEFDVFLFCASTGDLEELKVAMCEKSKDNMTPYDACLELTDREGFETWLKSAVYCGIDSNVPMAGMRPTTFREVDYSEKTRDARIYEHSPYIKRLRFKPQKEIRITVESRLLEYRDIKIVEARAPDLGNFFTRRF